MKNSLYMLSSATSSQMNSFIITTADEKVIVIDGGLEQDAPNMIQYIKDITGQEVPRVDAWILSHPHHDHINCFLEIVEKYPETLDVACVMYHCPSVQFVEREERGIYGCLPRFYADLPLFVHKSVIVSLGDVFDVGEAHFECLYSTNPELIHNVANNSSLVLMMHLAGKKVLFLGDAGEDEGRKILAFYNDHTRLKADYVQMAHHGQQGVDKDFYKAVSPTACLWCTPKWLWDNDAGGGFDTHVFKTVEVRGWMQDLGVQHHYVTMNGTQVIDL